MPHARIAQKAAKLLPVYAHHKGRRDHWLIGQSVERPDDSLIRRAGIAPETVLEILKLYPTRSRPHWLVVLPHDSRTADLPPRSRKRGGLDNARRKLADA